MSRSASASPLRVFDFNRAIVRSPAPSVVDGLRAIDRGNPTFEGVRAEHDAYAAALRTAGLELTVLPPLGDFPDSVFVEDSALVFSDCAILLRPGAPSRAAEVAEMAPTLRSLFDVMLELPSGCVDGGDVLVTPQRVIIGLSDRTNQAGAEALAACLAELDRESVIVATPSDVLHLKTACALLDEETVLCTPSLAETGIFNGFRQVMTIEDEEAAANALRVNEMLLVGAEFPRTIERLEAFDYSVVPLATSQIGSIDAGLSCMSLRWWDPSA